MTCTDAPGLPRRLFLKGLLAPTFLPGFADKHMPQLPAPRHLRGMTVPMYHVDEGWGGFYQSGDGIMRRYFERIDALRRWENAKRTARAFGGSVTKSPALYARGVYRLLGSTAPQAVLYHQPSFEWALADSLTASNALGFAKGGKESIVLDLDKARLDASLLAAHPRKDVDHADVTRTLL